MSAQHVARSLALVFAAGIIGAVGASGGCAWVVGDAIPPFNCLPDTPSACPVGSVCVPATHKCVAGAETCTETGCAGAFACDSQTLKCASARLDGGGDAARMDAASAKPDTGSALPGDGGDATMPNDAVAVEATDAFVPDVSADARACRTVTCKCASPSDCNSGICADSLTVTEALYVANSSTSFCTQACCTSADCPAATVCFGSGAGGNYCVAPSWLGRDRTPGTVAGGATCRNSSDCRSGLCAGGVCADTCCSTPKESTECASGSVCRFAAFPGTGFDVHETAWCGAGIGGSPGGGPCAIDSECTTGKCSFMRCQAACRSSADCGGPGQACVYGLGPGPLTSTKDIVAACFAFTAGPGAEGANCSVSSDCQSNFCDGAHCTDVCFADSDCKGGFHCRPKMVSVQSGGSYSVLCCEG